MKVQIYEWLKGDGNAWIDSGVKDNKGDYRYEIKFKKADTPNLSADEVVLGSRIPETVPAIDIISSDQSNKWMFFVTNHYPNRYYVPLNDDNVVVLTPSKAIINGTEYSSSNGTYSNINIGLFKMIVATPQHCFRGSIAYFKTDTIHLRPCRLLSPYTDAQGKLHPQGECCMIDINTNTLYFNQGSGAFSVEGEAGEIIDTTPFSQIMHKRNEVVVRLREYLTSSSSVTLLIRGQDIKSVSAKILCGSSTGTGGALNVLFIGQNNARLGFNVWRDYWDVRATSTTIGGGYAVDMTAEIEVDADGNYLIRKNEEIYSQGNVSPTPDKWMQSEYIIIRKGDRVYYIKTNEHNLHPCDLLHHPTLPPQSCMIDLNSGQLYTDQGTGSFSCEGADLGIWQSNPVTDMVTLDANKQVKRILSVWVNEQGMLRRVWEKNEPWEEHRWLVANVPTGCTMLTLQVNDTLRYKRLWKQVGNAGYVRNDNFAFYSADNNKLNTVSIWNIETQSSGLGYLIDDGVIDVSINPKNYKIGTFESQDYLGDNILFVIGNNANGQREAIFNTSTITIDGHTLTPVILSRPILASEDANGRARQKGEAVMVDKKKYKLGQPFVFGNVASSGSFSVSDYLIEGEDYEVISGVVSAKGAYITLREMPQTLSINLNTPKDINFGGAVVFVGDSNNNKSQMYPDSYNADYPYQWVNQGFIFSYWQVDFHAKKDYNFRIDENGDVYESDIKRSIKIALWTTKTECRLFVSNDDGDFIYKSVSSDICNLIPVRLKKAIDPTCTHNGKGARQGEIGFFDKVSGRFYGNDGKGEFGEYVP